MLKTINPFYEYEWSPPDSPDTIFYYTAYGGPIIPVGDAANRVDSLVKSYFDKCIKGVKNITLPVKIKDKDGNETVEMKDFEEWRGFPKMEWHNILPPAIATQMFINISNATSLLPEEERDL